MADARYRVEQWLRERQVSRAKKVLIITGRGNSTPIISRPYARGIRAVPVFAPPWGDRGMEEHTAGAFVVSLAPIRHSSMRHDDAATAAPSRRP